MASFDIVSEVNKVELKNAVDQANKEIAKIGTKVKQPIHVKAGIEQEKAKSIVKLIKDSKMKVQASIQGAAVRVSGGKKDDLQAAIVLVRKSVTDIPLQFQNFRD